jgi:hypothetical protein
MFVDDSDDDEEEEVPVQADKAADYHAILDVLLESLRELIADGMIVDINYKGQVYKNCELVFFVPFVKCDGDEGDKLCLSYRSRGKDISQLCRICKCPNEETDDVNAHHDFKTETEMKKLYAKKDLKKHKDLSQICAKNAFHSIRFGLHNDRGIHGATPMDMLHGCLLGNFQYARNNKFAQLGENSRAAQEVNALAQEIGRLLQQQSDRNKPRTKFAKGIQKGKLMAKEYAGVLLVMAAIFQSKKGKEILRSAYRKGFRADGQIEDWTMLVETLLQWESYLNLVQMKKIHVERLKRKHRYLLFLIKRVGDRKTGMGCKVMKFHAVLHVAEDILMFGVPRVVDTESNESHHKTTKIAAKLTQKDVHTFEQQTCNRLDDFLVLDLALQELEGRPLWLYSESRCSEEKEIEEIPNTTGGMILSVEREGEEVFAKIKTRMKSKCLSIDTQFLQYCLAIQDRIGQEVKDFKLCICSEHKRSGQLFRSHPNYRGKGPWRDWVMVKWAGQGDFPSMIWGFLDLRELPEGCRVRLSNEDKTVVDKGVWAVIESCNYTKIGPNVKQSELFTHIKLDATTFDQDGNVLQRRFFLVDVETFVRPVVVIPNVGTKTEYLMMKPKVEWSEDFIKWIESKHIFDVQEMQPLPVEEIKVARRRVHREEDSDSNPSDSS